MFPGVSKTVLRLLIGVSLTLGFGQHVLACSSSVTVKRGDTLAKFARAHLGSVFRYNEIYSANRSVIGRNPNLLRAGQKLKIPCGSQPTGFDRSRMPDAKATAVLARQTKLQMLDIRSPKALEKSGGIIAGAISVPFAKWRGPKGNPGQVPPDAVLSDLIGQSGLRLDRPIVVVDKSGHPMALGRAAYVYWILKSLGAERLAILRDGHKGWVEAELPVAQRPASFPAYEADVRFADTWLATYEEVAGIANGSVRGALLDSRPDKFYRRKAKGQSQPSTLPGALNSSAMEATNTLTKAPSVEEGVLNVLERLKVVRVDWEAAPVVTFCETGELSALNWFYSSELSGIQNVRLYPESARGWKAAGGELVIPPPGKSIYEQ